jgi:hypothetical protein
MTADEIEKSYQEVTSGYEEPKIMWILGKTLKEFLAKQGGTRTATNDGHVIVDGEMYCVTDTGIWLAE